MLSKDLLKDLRMPWEKELDNTARKLKMDLMFDLMMDEIDEAKKKKEKERKHLYNLKRNKFKRR